MEENLRKDFAGFTAKLAFGANVIQLAGHCQAPDFRGLPDLPGPSRRGRAFSYDAGPVRYNDFSGKALSRYDFSSDTGEVWCEDPALLYELLYLMLHSRVGERWERRGIFRVHGLAFLLRGRRVLFLMPEGGGKTSLFLRLLQYPGVELYSDDIVLVDRDLRIFPFPSRFRLTAEEVDRLGIKDRAAVFARQGRETKYLVEPGILGVKPAAPGLPDLILAGRRKLNGSPEFLPLGFAGRIGTLSRDLVIGWGLPQMVEYFLRSGGREWGAKAWLAARRLARAARLAAVAPGAAFLMGRDLDANAEALVRYLEGRGG